ncbi:MAG: DinB family protein [Acidobacteriota bacterium]|nr:DinB family protein [Acidobacteriota bacterium]
MSLREHLAVELKQEAATTRKMLERIPTEAFDWKPHEKSTSFGRLATHVVEMTGWLADIIQREQIDFNAGDYIPKTAKTREELVEMFDQVLANCLDALQNVPDEHFMQTWTLRSGDQIFFQSSRIAAIRGACFNHMIHHRGQLSVYMRLRDLPVPAMYGPSADEPMV